MQLANEINARRILDEYDIFNGLFSSPIFMGVIIITAGLQAIIINFLGAFFKVSEPLATSILGTPPIPQQRLCCCRAGAGELGP